MEKQDTLDLFQEQAKFVKGRPIVTIFHNEQNLYTVLRIRVDETNHNYEDKEAVVTGYFPKIHEQESYIFFGELRNIRSLECNFTPTISERTCRKQNKALQPIYQVKCLKGLARKQPKVLSIH